MQVEAAISILEDILQKLQEENGLNTIDSYIKALRNPKIEKLTNKYNKYILKYGKSEKRTMKLTQKIDAEISKIIIK